MNQTARAARASKAIKKGGYDNCGEELNESVVDLITDLRHLCDQKDLDLYAMLDTSYSHYLQEK